MTDAFRPAVAKALWLTLTFCAPLAPSLTALAEEPVAQSPVLSPGWTFAEQGGASIYANVCAACHQAQGQGAIGAGAYPALANNPELASADYVLRVLLQGQGGMPPLGAMMNDQQVADVIAYVRTHFGNAYEEAVSAADVKAARPPGP